MPRRTIIGGNQLYKGEAEYGDWRAELRAEDDLLDKKAAVMGPYAGGGDKGPFWYHKDKYWYHHFCHGYFVSKEYSTVRPPVPSERVYEGERVGELDVDTQDVYAGAIYDKVEKEFLGFSCMEAYRKKYTFDLTKKYMVDFFDLDGELKTSEMDEKDSIESAADGEALEAGFWFCREKYHITKRETFPKKQPLRALRTQMTMGTTKSAAAGDASDAESEDGSRFQFIFANRPHRGLWMLNDNKENLVFIAMWRGDPDVNGYNCKQFLIGAHRKFVTRGWNGDYLERWRRWIQGDEDLDYVQNCIREFEADPCSVRRGQQDAEVAQMLDDAKLWLDQAKLKRRESQASLGRSLGRGGDAGRAAEELIKFLHDTQGKVGKRVWVLLSLPVSDQEDEKLWMRGEILEDSFNGKFQVRVEVGEEFHHAMRQTDDRKFPSYFMREADLGDIFQEQVGKSCEVASKTGNYEGVIQNNLLNDTFLVRGVAPKEFAGKEERVEIDRITFRLRADGTDPFGSKVWVRVVVHLGGFDEHREDLYVATVRNVCSVQGKDWFEVMYDESLEWPNDIVLSEKVLRTEEERDRFLQGNGGSRLVADAQDEEEGCAAMPRGISSRSVLVRGTVPGGEALPRQTSGATSNGH